MLKRTTISIASLLALGALAAPAFAQSSQRIEVTGSKIKRVDAEGLQPIVTIRREDIEKSGKATVNELLSSLTVVSGGGFSEASGSGNTFAPGTSSVSLRGLGVNTTLVLLNGRRIANYGFAQNLNEGFVDLNSIPVNAVERIDVLKDGASAIYGSDAIAGVINVILRKDFSGVEVSASVSGTQDGGGNEVRTSVTAGAVDLLAKGFNASITLDYLKRDAIKATDRSYSKSADQRGNGPGAFDNRSPTGNPGYLFGGAGNSPTAFATCPANRIVTAASLGVGGGGTVCAEDFTYANNLLPETERFGALARANFSLSAGTELFAEAMFSRNTTEGLSAPTPASFPLVAGHPQRPAGSTFTNVAYRTVEAGNRENTLVSDSTRLVAGARGVFGGNDWELGFMQSRNEVENAGRNYIIQQRANEAFSGTLAGFTGQYYNFLNPSANPPGMLDAIKIAPVRTGDSKLDSVDFKISRDLFDLPGGSAALAAGIEYRKESVSDTPDFRVALTNPSRVTVAGSGGTAVDGGRDLTSFYGEVSLPFAKGLETQLALRSDRYSDFGTATTPKVGVSFRPNAMFLIRAGYAEGFRAPSLVELFLGESISFPNVNDTARCNDYRAAYGATDPRAVTICSARPQVRSSFVGSKDLGPEKSKSSSFGIVLEPIPGIMSAALDVYYIEHTSRILSPTATFILNNEAFFPGAVRRNAPSADDIAANARGSLRGVSGDDTVGVVRTFFNASQQRTHGADFDVRYRFNLGSLGRLDTSTSFSYIGSLKRQLNPGQPLAELVTTFGFPRWRNGTSFQWTIADWATTVNVNTLGKYQDFYTDDNDDVVYVKRFTTVDLQLSYTGFKGLTLAGGVNNLTNEKPPFSNNGWQGFDTSRHDPKGAAWYARVKYAF